MPTGTRDAPGPLTAEVASLLRQRIAELNIRAVDVSKGAGIAQATLSRILNAKTQVYVEQLHRICLFLTLDIGTVLDAADAATRALDTGRGTSITPARTPQPTAASRRPSPGARGTART